MHARLATTAVFTTAVLAAALLTLPAAAGPFPAACAGSYVIAEDGGTTSLWTFVADGTFFGTTSTQPLFNFSNQQGSWSRDGNDGGHGVLIAFVWNGDDTLATVARTDIAFAPTGVGCDEIAGSLVVRTFEDGEDVLDPSTDADDPIAEDTWTGRRIVAGG